MKEIAVWVVLILIGGKLYGQEKWKKERIKVPAPICYTNEFEHHSHISPVNILKKAPANRASIIVTYSGFTAEAQLAFQYAVDLWQNMIYSTIPIRVKANWVILDKGVLGNCSAADYYKNFEGSQIWNCYYPVALAEKLLDEEINSTSSADIIANFNKDITTWYFGTDGKTPANKFDFVSTVLHELAHGFGFSGFFYSANGRGGYGSDGLPAIYDLYVKNKLGEKLTNKTLFTNPSVKLHQNLTSGWLEFDTKQLSNNFPRLYSPVTWDNGSSIYHLDEDIYPIGNSNSLMTPFTRSGESIHDPGESTLAILNDLGWKSVIIKHKSLKDIELNTKPIEISATVKSDLELDVNKLYVYYSSNKFLKVDSVKLLPSATPNLYNATINKSFTGEIRYYISASDILNRRYFYPANSPTRYFTFNIGIDKISPVVKHEPTKFILSTAKNLSVNAIVTDNIDVKTVKVEYFINGGLINEKILTKGLNDKYSGEIIFDNNAIKGGDIVSYRIVATDASSQSNIGRLPLSGYYKVNVEDINKPVDRYLNNFDAASNDFAGTDFNVSTPIGFLNPALNTAHPYLSPNTDNAEFNFVTILKSPIILKSGGKMSFDEIVLVEPGEPGTKAGDEEFWDFVIVEGSKDYGKTWLPLTEGYDSNSQKTWYNLFISSVIGQDSKAIPTKDNFVKKEIDLLENGNFKAGDTILVQFRLFSDPYANGWGWIIDNLVIQDYKTGLKPLAISQGEVVLYPNPAIDVINLELNSKKFISNLRIRVINSLGKEVLSLNRNVGDTKFSEIINLSQFGNGIYIFIIEGDNFEAISRKILIQ